MAQPTIRAPWSDRRGFTLMEIMVAVALLAVVSTLLYSSFALMVRAQTETELLQERYHTARVAMERMTRELSMAFLSKHVNQEEDRSRTVFLGDKNKVTFTSLAHQRRIKESRESDQAAIEYFVKSVKGGGKGLFRRVKPLPDPDPEKGGTVELLASDVKSIEFEYWDRENEDWKSSWDVTSDDFEVGQTGLQVSEEQTDEDKTLQLPWRVRIRLVLRGEDRQEYTFETQAAMYLREPLDFTYGLGGGRGGPRVGGQGLPGQPFPGQGLAGHGGQPGLGLPGGGGPGLPGGAGHGPPGGGRGGGGGGR